MVFERRSPSGRPVARTAQPSRWHSFADRLRLAGITLPTYLIALLLVSFPLHFAWEWYQCQPYFVHRATPANAVSMLVATTGDLLLTLVAYAVVALLHGSQWPLRRWGPATSLTLVGTSLVLAFAMEAYALSMGRWTYTDAAPLVPGAAISMLPVVQLLVLVPASFLAARAIVERVARA